MRTALPLAGLVIAAIGAAQTAQQRPRPLVRQVDHIVAQSDDPQQLFAVLTGTLRLPVASPLRADSASVTGGVGIGNVSLELFRPADLGELSKTRRASAHFTSIAFEPYKLDQALTELQARGIPYATPQSYASTLPDGTQGTLSTTVVLPELSNPAMSAFLYEYSRAFLNVQIRRRQWAGELVLNRGGPLGIELVKEIVIGTDQLRTAKPRWEKFLLPFRPSSVNVWKPGEGPAVRLASSAGVGIQRMVLKVKSLAQAKDFLKARRWLGTVSDEEIAIAPSAVQGLNIRLAEN